MSRDFLRDAERTKREAHGRLMRSLAGMPEPVDETTPEPEPQRMPSLDGGARMSVAVKPTHEETLLAIIAAERRPNTGGMFGG